MYSIKNFLMEKIKEFIYDFDKNLINEDISKVEVTRSPLKGFHYSTNVLYVFKNIDQQKLIDFLRKQEIIEKVEIIRNFVNIELNKQNSFRMVLQSYLKDKWSSFDLGKNKRVLIEFVSANPTGPLNAVNGRSATFGSVLANVLKYFNFSVFKEYYVNDVGEQIEKLVDSFIERIKEVKSMEFKIPEDGYLGEYLKDIAKLYVLNNYSLDRLAIKNFLIDYFVNQHRNTLRNFKVEFDNWFRQSNLNDLFNTLDYLKEKGFLHEDNGAIFFKSTLFGDDKDRVIKKTVGKVEYTYFAYDIEYIKNKYSRGFDKLITILGPDHHGYVNRLLAATKALGFQDHQIIILQIVNVIEKDKQLKMSKRKGVLVLLDELIEKVNPDFLKYFFISRLKDSPIDLDIDFINKLTIDNPLYYVFYAYARICGVLRNYNQNLPEFDEVLNIDITDEEFELFLITQEFRDYLFSSLNDPYYLTLWSYNVAKVFHKFYNSYKIISSKRERIRIFLIVFLKGVLELWAKLLNITLPERM